MRHLTFAAALMLLVSACANDPHDSDAGEMPRCSDVWVEGDVLPEDYQGCREGVAVIRPEFVDCERREGRLATYKDFVALLGTEIEVVPGGPDNANIFAC